MLSALELIGITANKNIYFPRKVNSDFWIAMSEILLN